MDIGPRVKLARARMQMSTRELAQQVGVSAAAISKFERGEISPSQRTLLRLAKALSVGVEYFFREVRVKTLAPAYRKHSALGKSVQKAIEATIVETVERYLIVEEYTPQRAVDDIPTFAIQSIQDAEQAARAIRNKWELGNDPIDDLCGRLEDRGVKVIAVDAPQGFDGYSCWANDSIPVVAFNTRASGDRQRFDLAHELGHLILCGDTCDPEKAAHRFAAALLVPAEAAVKELGERRSNLSFEELRLLKLEYGFSIQAWVRRAYDLGIIPQHTYGTLFRRLATMGWRTQEPGEVPREEPQRFQLLIHQALAENRMTPIYASQLLRDVQSIAEKPTGEQLARVADTLIELYATDPDLTDFADADLEDESHDL
ncbi:MAG: helix-turn-helix domain-containing protein [Bacilli bacterium]